MKSVAAKTGGQVVDTRDLIERAYSAFNRRDVEGALALMTDDVRWPRASESGTVVGKDEIRAYWARQWSAYDPNVEPLAMTNDNRGKTRVRVRQLVKSVAGELLSDGEVVHLFTVDNGLIAAMELGDDADPIAGPSSAFACRS